MVPHALQIFLLFRSRKWKSYATNRQKVHKYIREFSPGCEVSSTAFPSKCCRNVATRAVRHILSCCSPFTSRGVKEGKGGKYVHSSPANPRKHLTAVVIHHSPCLQNRFNYFLGMQPHIFSQWLIFENSRINQLEFFTLEFLISLVRKIRKLLSL